MRFKVCSLFRSIDNGRLIKLRSGGALRWKAEDSRLGSRGPPAVSVKDRWVGPREQVLNVPIAC
jgi:hypothetical protein